MALGYEKRLPLESFICHLFQTVRFGRGFNRIRRWRQDGVTRKSMERVRAASKASNHRIVFLWDHQMNAYSESFNSPAENGEPARPWILVRGSPGYTPLDAELPQIGADFVCEAVGGPVDGADYGVAHGAGRRAVEIPWAGPINNGDRTGKTTRKALNQPLKFESQKKRAAGGCRRPLK